jgi:hypothetical protein
VSAPRPELKPLSRAFFAMEGLMIDGPLTIEAVFDAYFDCRRTRPKKEPAPGSIQKPCSSKSMAPMTAGTMTGS